MKTFSQFMSEAKRPYDPSIMGSSQITGGGGETIGRDRKQPTQMSKRTVRHVDPETGEEKEIPISYRRRKDAGAQRPTETRVQQPTKPRGSAEVAAAAAAAAKRERDKATAARAAAKKAGKPAPTQTLSAKEAEREASKLLSTKKPEAKPAASSGPTDNMIRGVFIPKDPKTGKPVRKNYSRSERVAVTRAGEALTRDIHRGTNRPAEYYKGILKPGSQHASERRRAQEVAASNRG